MKTKSFRKIDQQEKWFVVDATDKVLGRLATEIATILRGKHKPTFTPHEDLGDHIIVINSDRVKLTGNKLTDKKYYHHTGYIGGIKEITAGKLMEKDSTQVITKAVTGMLPKTRLGRSMATKLRVYTGDTHPHASQQPEALNL